MRAATPEPPPERPSSARRALLNPFSVLGPRTTAALAAAAVGLGLAAAHAGMRFDGPLDLDIVGGPVPPGTALAEQAVALLAPALAGWAALRGLGTPARLGRLLAVLGAARLPLMLAAPLAFVPLRVRARSFVVLIPGTVAPDPTPGAVIDGLASLGLTVAFVWFVAWAVAAVRAASGLRGRRLAAASAAAILGGELLGKLALLALALRTRP